MIQHRHMRTEWRERTDRASPWKGLIAGVAGGMAGVLAMTAFQNVLSTVAEHVSNGSDDGESDGESSASQEPATVKAADRISSVIVGHEVRDEHRQLAGQAVHYGFGVTTGAVYGVLAEYAPEATVGGGAPFGAALMLVADEIAVPALRLSGPPTEMSPTTHLYALASHLVYGMTAEAVRRGVRATW